MTIQWKCKTSEAYIVKILAELLSNNIKTGAFEINETGIYLCMMDSKRSILIDLQLKAENFSIYKFNSKKLFIGLNLNHLHKMVKSVKKKDSIELFIDDKAPNDLAIRVIPKENNRITTSYIKIQNVQNLEIDIPKTLSKPIIVSSSDYQKLVKEMSNIGTIMKVTSKNFRIEFSCNAGGILKRTVSFGENDEEEDDDEDGVDEFSEEFITEQLCRITKLSGLSNNMQIYPGKPLLFKTRVGGLGTLGIYIKSKAMIEEENFNTLDSDGGFDSDA